MTESAPIPFESVSIATLVKLFEMNGFTANPITEEVILLPGPGAMTLHRHATQPRLAVNCGFRFTRGSAIIDRLRFANHMSKHACSARCFVKDDLLICVHDILCTGGMLPEHVIYAYRYLRGAMDLVDKAGQVHGHW